MKVIKYVLLFISLTAGLTPGIKQLALYTANSYKKIISKSLIEENDTFGLRTFDEKQNMIITCRGTTNLVDWFNNINCVLVEYNIGRVHRGYFKNLLTIIKNYNLEIDSSTKNVYVLGHSSGGGKAILLGYYLANKHKEKKINIVVFGTPKMANNIFYDNLDSKKNMNFVSIRLQDDIIPYLGRGYNPENKTIILKPHSYCINPVTAHSMKRYILELDLEDSHFNLNDYLVNSQYSLLI